MLDATRRELRPRSSNLSSHIFVCQPLEGRLLLATVSGPLVQWQPLTMDFQGPQSSEISSSPNPFLDYRLQVAFRHEPSGKVYNVPGYFDGNGSGAGAGTVWRVRFTPDWPGDWSYVASFRAGENVAVDLNPSAGEAVEFDGEAGTIVVQPPDPSAPDFLRWGRLEYAGGAYHKFRDGPYWIKGGTNSPENFLGYSGFDNTPNALHSYAGHVADWRSGDPDWGAGKGRGIIGAINYLSSQQVNELYLMPMNVGGDAKDTWPFALPLDRTGDEGNDNLHYDVSKLGQWGIVFEHAQRQGIQIQMVLNEAEAENKSELDEATLGVERKLYYREMAARFGHLNALQWNISEEYNYKLPLAPETVEAFAGYLQSVDPYDHPITVHNYGSVSAFAPFLGDGRFSATSFQMSASASSGGDTIEAWRDITAASGRPIPIYYDEPRSTSTSNMVAQRKELLWPTYLSGGAGIEWYIGNSDVTLDDFRPYQSLWQWTAYARRFMQDYLPFQQMQPADGLLAGESSGYGGGQVFAKPGDTYAVYLPDASAGGTLDLSGSSGQFVQQWYNPRTGQFEGTAKTVNGGDSRMLGLPPASSSEDWVILLNRSGSEPPPEPIQPPAAPSNLSAAPTSSTSVGLTWTDNAADESGYRIERSTDGLLFTQVATTIANATTYTDQSLLSAIKYYYRVRAYNSAGPSASSNVASATTPGDPLPIGAAVESFVLVNADTEQDILVLRDGMTLDLSTLPTRNLNIRADVSGVVESVTFGWDGVDAYRVEQFAPFALAGDSGGNYTAWTPSTGSHVLSATPRDSTGQVGAAESIGLAVVDGPGQPVPLPPDAPTALNADASSSSSVNLTWVDNADNELTHEVERSQDGKSFALVATLGPDAYTCKDEGLAASTTYWYRVRAVNQTGPSVYSAVASVTTPAAPVVVPPTAPSGLVAWASSSSTVALSWVDTAADEAGFRIERTTGSSGTWSEVAAVGVDNTTYQDSGLLAGTSYTYRVCAYNSNGVSEYSNTATALTPVALEQLAVVQFVLINSDNDQPLMTLGDGDVISLSSLATRNLNIGAVVDGGASSVIFFLNGQRTRRETTSPFAMFGDRKGDYFAWTPSPATYTFSATPYSGTAAGASLTIRVTFIA